MSIHFFPFSIRCIAHTHIHTIGTCQSKHRSRFFFFAQFNSSFIFAIAACIVVQCCIHRHFVSRETVYSKLTWMKIFVFDFGLTWLDLIIINIIMVRYIHYSSFHSKFVDFFHHLTLHVCFVVCCCCFYHWHYHNYNAISLGFDCMCVSVCLLFDTCIFHNDWHSIQHCETGFGGK